MKYLLSWRCYACYTVWTMGKAVPVVQNEVHDLAESERKRWRDNHPVASLQAPQAENLRMM